MREFLRVIGVLVLVLSNTAVAHARFQLGSSWSIRPKAKQLVTHGMYTKIRNPMYFFHVLMTLGVMLILQWRWLWALLLFEIIVQTIRAHKEAQVLCTAFGEKYEAYRKGTWF